MFRLAYSTTLGLNKKFACMNNQVLSVELRLTEISATNSDRATIYA